MAASVRARLLNRARETKQDFNLVLTRYAIDVEPQVKKQCAFQKKLICMLRDADPVRALQAFCELSYIASDWAAFSFILMEQLLNPFDKLPHDFRSSYLKIFLGRASGVYANFLQTYITT